MKKFIHILSLLPLFIAPISAFAQVTISPAIPSMGSVASTTPPGAFVGGFYQFALMIGGVLAFGAVVYGGVLYAASAGNPSKQSEGKEWIKSAIFGLLLLAAAYLVLYTINPNLVNLGLPTLQSVNITAANGSIVSGNGSVTGLGSNQETQTTAAAALAATGVGVVSTGNCSDQNNPNCTSLAGIRDDTLFEAISVKNQCGCTVTISGGTETGHDTAANGVDHADGYKIDLQANSGLTNFIETPSLSGFTQIANRTSDGAAQYVDPATGAVYAYEASKNHWDVTVP